MAESENHVKIRAFSFGHILANFVRTKEQFGLIDWTFSIREWEWVHCF